MTTPMGGTNTYQIAIQETQNQQLLIQMAQREAQSAGLVGAMAANNQGPMAAGLQQLAAQEMQNTVLLRQMAAREAVNASQLGLASSGGGAGALPGTTALPATGSSGASANVALPAQPAGMAPAAAGVDTTGMGADGLSTAGGMDSLRPATNAAALTGIATGIATGPMAGTAYPPPRGSGGII
jgi:hypothetical protein